LSVTESQREVAASIGVPTARRHIFLCCDQEKPKCCDKDRGLAAWSFLKQRLKEHNEGRSPHTAKFRPWVLVAYFAFANEKTAISF